MAKGPTYGQVALAARPCPVPISAIAAIAGQRVRMVAPTAVIKDGALPINRGGIAIPSHVYWSAAVARGGTPSPLPQGGKRPTIEGRLRVIEGGTTGESRPLPISIAV